MDWTAVTAATGVLLAIGSYVLSFSQRRKNDADAAEAISKAAQGLLDPLNKQIADLNTEVAKAKDAIIELEAKDKAKTAIINRQAALIAEMSAGIKLLNVQLVRLNQKPLYEPPSDKAIQDAMLGVEGV